MVYETLLVLAVVFVGAAIATAAARGLIAGPARVATQVFLVALLSAYFVASWRRGGQTLPMKAWKLRLVSADGGAVSLPRALFRFALAATIIGAAAIGAAITYRDRSDIAGWLALLPAALSVTWGFFDVQGRFLHDRLSGTKIVHEKTLLAARS